MPASLAAIAIGVFAGLGPAVADSRVNLVSALKATGYFGGGRGGSRLRRVLVIAEVTITVMLLAGVTILARGAIELHSQGGRVRRGAFDQDADRSGGSTSVEWGRRR